MDLKLEIYLISITPSECSISIIANQYSISVTPSQYLMTIVQYSVSLAPSQYFISITPQWGAVVAEIKVPSGENTELKRSSFKA